MYKLKSPEIAIHLQVEFGEWSPGVGEDYEDAKTFRIYNDGVWEFLDKNGLPICQGVDAKVTVLDADSAIVNRERNE